MTNVFYCRISTDLQNDARQLEYAKQLGIEPQYIFNDHFTGTTMKRKELERMNQFLRMGDVVHVESISRIGRTTLEVIQLIEAWNKKGIYLVSQKEHIDTRTKNPYTEALYVIYALYSSIEHKQRKQRCEEGMIMARLRGEHIGRRKLEDLKGSKNKKYQIESAVQERLEKNTSMRTLSKKYGVAINTIYRYIREHRRVDY